MNTTIGAIAPIVDIDGTTMPPNLLERLASVRVERAVGLVGRTTLRFIDGGFSVSAGAHFSLGTKVSISEPPRTKLFEGVVTGVSLDQRENGQPELTVIVDDAAYKLTRGTHIETYTNLSYADVIKKIAGRVGLSPDVESTTVVMDYLLQAGTDLEFLNVMTERAGLGWWVEGASTLKVKQLTIGAPATTLTLHDDLDEFAVRASGLRPTGVTVNGWNPDTQDEVKETSTTAPGPTPQMLTKYVGSGPSGPLSAADTSVADHPALTADEASTVAKALLADWAAAAVVARGTADVNGKVDLGKTVAVADAGPASGNYLVTGVEHVYDRTGFFTKFTAGSARPASLVDTLGAPVASPGFVVPGLVVGIVTDNKDPDDAGRVKVRFTGVTGDIESPWSRVVTLGAGAKRGIVFQPEVNDEVLVGFERGDTRRPVVIGGLFSKKHGLPAGAGEYLKDNKVNYRRITSRSNHMIEMADGTERTDQYILLLLGTAQHKVRLGADRFDVEVADGIPMTIKAGTAKFDISEAGDITVEGNNITIKAKQALNLQAQTQASLKGLQVAVEGQTTVDVKSDLEASVQATGELALKGLTVMIN